MPFIHKVKVRPYFFLRQIERLKPQILMRTFVRGLVPGLVLQLLFQFGTESNACKIPELLQHTSEVISYGRIGDFHNLIAGYFIVVYQILIMPVKQEVVPVSMLEILFKPFFADIVQTKEAIKQLPMQREMRLDCFYRRPDHINKLGIRKTLKQRLNAKEREIHFRNNLLVARIVNLPFETVFEKANGFFLMGLIVVEAQFAVAFFDKSQRSYYREELGVQNELK